MSAPVTRPEQQERPPRPDLEKVFAIFSASAYPLVHAAARYALYLEASRPEIEQKARRWDAIEPYLEVKNSIGGEVNWLYAQLWHKNEAATPSEFVDALARGGK